MAIKMGVTTVKAMLDAFETDLLVGGTAPKLILYAGAPPANAATADAALVIATFTLATDPMANAANAGTKTFNAITSVNASAAGTIGHYRLYRTDGTTCVDQGTVGTSGADMIIDSANVVLNQPINVTSWVKDMSAYI